MSGPDDYIEVNRVAWNRRTEVHVASDFYDMPGFKAGELRSSLLRSRYSVMWWAGPSCTCNATSDKTLCRWPAWGRM